jgi:hypothetical protein
MREWPRQAQPSIRGKTRFFFVHRKNSRGGRGGLTELYILVVSRIMRYSVEFTDVYIPTKGYITLNKLQTE